MAVSRGVNRSFGRIFDRSTVVPLLRVEPGLNAPEADASLALRLHGYCSEHRRFQKRFQKLTPPYRSVFGPPPSGRRLSSWALGGRQQAFGIFRESAAIRTYGLRTPALLSATPGGSPRKEMGEEGA